MPLPHPLRKLLEFSINALAAPGTTRSHLVRIDGKYADWRPNVRSISIGDVNKRASPNIWNAHIPLSRVSELFPAFLLQYPFKVLLHSGRKSQASTQPAY